MKQVTISSKKATRGHLALATVAVVVLACVRMHAVVLLAQAIVPTSSMVGQEVFAVLAIVGLWYLVWGGIVLALLVRVCIRLIAMCVGK